MDLKGKIEKVRGELGAAIERRETPEKIMRLSVELDKLIEQYLEQERKMDYPE